MKLDVPEGLISFDQPDRSGRDGDVDGETRLPVVAFLAVEKSMILSLHFHVHS